MGMSVTLFDGMGSEATGEIIRADRKAMRIQADHITHYPFELSLKITLAVAFPKAHRQGVMIEKCTELGVAAIWPIVTSHSVVKPTSSSIEKWSRRAVEAAKQSGRTWVPQIELPKTFDQCLEQHDPFDVVVLLDIDATEPTLPSLLKSCEADSSILILIGPEGGWTQDERDKAIARGYVRSTISPTVLRTETAAIAACAIAASLYSKASA